MSNIVSDLEEYKTVDELKKRILALERENKAWHLTVDKLLKEQTQKNEQLKHLESLISQSVPVVKPESTKLTVVIAPEDEIAEVQLERLRQAARNRTLTLEEIRAFDLLVKNKRLVMDESTINLGKNQYRNVDEADLLKLAATEVKSNDPDAD